MALQKQPVGINFSQGLDLKTDPYQVPLGKFLSLKNSVFQKGGLLQKRNGFGALPSLPDATSTFATTFNGNLTAIGTTLKAFSSGSQSWVTKGNIQPLELSTLPLIRSNTNQSQADSVVASNGLVCTVFTDQDPASLSSKVYKYVIADSVTGQNIVAPTLIPVASGAVSGSPRVFLLGSHFMIVFNNVITAVNHLQYVAISTVSPTTVSANTNISSLYTPAATLAFDGVVANNNLYLAWNGSDGGGAIRVTYIDSTLTQHSTVAFAGKTCSIMSVTADVSGTNPVIYLAFYALSGTTGYIIAVNQQLSTILAATQWVSSGTVSNVSCVAQNGVAKIYYEVANNYGYDSSIPSNLIKYRTCTVGGSLGTATTLVRSVGLASKAFIVDDAQYFLAAFQSPYQPSYFLMNSSGQVIAKLAYSNGGGYLTTGLPNVTVNGGVAQITYLFKDLIQSVNKNTNVPSGTQVNGIYSQLGINLASFTIGTSNIGVSEIGQALHLTGGFLSMYDGYLPVEHNFFLWPDSVEATQVADPVPTGTTTSGSATITSVSSVAGIVVGMVVTDTTNAGAIPANTTVIAVGTTTITMSANAAQSHVGDSLKFVGAVTAQQYFYQATYEWTDNQGNPHRSAPSIPATVTPTAGHTSVTVSVPTLRLTYKIANPVKIVIYRWSAGQQIYYQVTSITTPVLNDTTVDSVTFTDILSDSSILGNNIIYTNGGVIENIGAPACSNLTLFDDRLWLLDAEDGSVWYSKQVIPTVPVEMSDLLTIYVAPTIGSSGSTGNVKCQFPMDDKIIFFKSSALYYLNGAGPDNTGANNQYSQPIFITSTVGCENQQSIVFMPQGLMFQSVGKGIWLLGRDLSTTYIGAPVEAFNSAKVLSAVNVPSENQVRFTLDSGVTLMYDYYYGQWGTFAGVPAISSTIYQGLHTYINSFGQVFQETPGVYLDGTNPVQMSFTTSWINLAGIQGYQRIYEFFLLGTYFSPHKLAVQVAYDYAPSPSQTTIISPQNYSPVYGLDPVYGLNSPYGGAAQLEQWQVFTQQQRCQAFQITVTEIYDSTFQVPAGVGLTLSNINCVVGLKKGWVPLPAANSVG